MSEFEQWLIQNRNKIYSDLIIPTNPSAPDVIDWLRASYQVGYEAGRIDGKEEIIEEYNLNDIPDPQW